MQTLQTSRMKETERGVLTTHRSPFDTKKIKAKTVFFICLTVRLFALDARSPYKQNKTNIFAR